MKRDVSGFCQKLESLIKSGLEAIAKKTGFQKRSGGKIDPWVFVDIVVLLYNNHKDDTLDNLCLKVSDRYKIDIKKQSLDERFSSSAADFLEEVLKHILELQLSTSIPMSPVLDNFTKVKIKDSTEFKGYSKNEDDYVGFNSPGTKSCFQIQFEFDLKTCKVEDLCLTSGNNSDQTDAKETMESILPGELLIRDLGYISQQMLNYINAKGATYLNKIKKNIPLFTDSGTELSYHHILQKIKKGSLELWEEELYVGKETDHKSRVIIVPVPEKVYRERIKEIKANKKGKEISKEERARARLNVLITNADEAELPAKVAVELYRIRWQIELEFKSWKSCAKLACLKDTKTPRTECYILGKLIWLVLVKQTKLIVSHVLRPPTGISPIKFGKVAKQKQMNMANLTTEAIYEFINSILETPGRFIAREVKKTNKVAAKYLGYIDFND